jgi:hypothetical protein
MATQRRGSRPAGRAKGRPRRGRHESTPRARSDRASVGVGVTIIVYALAAAVKVPHALVLAIGAGGIAVIVGPFVPWRTILRWLWQRVGQGVQGAVESGRSQAASRACHAAADLLDELLAEHVVWEQARRWSQHLARRRLLIAYERNGRQLVLNAIHKAWETESVPPQIIRYAERPRSIGELQRLREWLRHRSDEGER